MAFTAIDFLGVNYLLVIGIDDYQHEAKLNNAVRDAKGIKTVLLEQYEGFEEEFIRELYNEDATEENIFKELKWLIHNVTKDDNVIIYYSGHGILDKDFDEGFWVSYESKRGDRSSCVPNIMLLRAIRRMNARHIALVSDSCFSGSIFANTRSVEDDSVLGAERKAALASRWGFSSGMEEVVSDGTAGEHSPFAAGIINYLKTNSTARVPFSRLIDHVTNVTAANAQQTPIGKRLQGVGDQNGEFMLEIKTDEETFWIATKTKDTVAAYNAFLVRFPDSEHKKEVWKRRLAAQKREAEEESWQLANTEKTIAAYQQYLEIYGENGKYSETANHIIATIQKETKIEEREAFKAAEEMNTLESYEYFLQTYPNSEWTTEVSQRTTPIRYQKYLQAYNDWLSREVDAKLIRSKMFDVEMQIQQQTNNNYIPIPRRKKGKKGYKNQKQNYESHANDRLYYILDAVMKENPTLQINYQERKGTALDLFQPILESFPWTVSCALKQMLACAYYERNAYMKASYTALLKTLCFIVLAQLWDEKETISDLNISASFKEVLDMFLKLNASNYHEFSYAKLLVGLIYLFKANNLTFFIPEIGNLVNNGTVMKAIDTLEKLDINAQEVNEEAEIELVRLFSEIAFLTKYEMIAIRSIQVTKDEKDQVIYQTKLSRLHTFALNTLQFDDSPIAMTTLLTDNAIIIRLANKNNTSFLNLTPFIFDKNTYYETSNNEIDIHLYQYVNGEAYIYEQLESESIHPEILSTQFSFESSNISDILSQKPFHIQQIQQTVNSPIYRDYYSGLRREFEGFQRSVDEESVQLLYKKWRNANALTFMQKDIEAIEAKTSVTIDDYKPRILLAKLLDEIVSIDVTQDPFDKEEETDNNRRRRQRVGILGDKGKMETIQLLIEDAPMPLTLLLNQIFKLSSKITNDNIQLLYEVYRKTTQIISFIALGELIKAKQTHENIKLDEHLTHRIKALYQLDKDNYLDFDYTLLLSEIYLFLRHHKIAVIEEKMLTLYTHPTIKLDFFETYQFFKGFRPLTNDFDNLPKSEQKQLFYLTEYYLSNQLRCVEFIFKMHFVSIRDANVTTNRTGQKVVFETKMGNCHGTYPMVDKHRKALLHFVPNQSILWTDNPTNLGQFINLSPFWIDNNAISNQDKITSALFEYWEDGKIMASEYVQNQAQPSKKAIQIQQRFKKMPLPKPRPLPSLPGEPISSEKPYQLKKVESDSVLEDCERLKALLLS